MPVVLGIDPGAHGAFSVYDSVTGRILHIADMPVWYQQIGKGSTKRTRVDAVAVAELFELFDVMGVELAVLEAVGGRPKQGANSAFVFGYGVGLVYMACVYTRIPVETVPAATWKSLMRVPGKLKGDDTAIMQRAGEMFPHDRKLFYTERGGKRVDRAEASMIAKFGADHILRAGNKTRDIENTLAYRNADLGG